MLSQDPGAAIAPHIAARIAELGERDGSAYGDLVGLLSSAQLRGMAVLPDPLPLPPTARLAAAEELSRCSPAVRRLLLTAALATGDRIDVIMAAAAVDIGIALDPDVSARLVLRDGRFHPTSPAVRAELIGAEPPERIAERHRALARATLQLGLRGEAAWHAYHGTLGSAPNPELLLFGRGLLRDGAVLPAHAVGKIVATSSDPALRAEGAFLAGRAALAMGCLEEATTLLRIASAEPRLEESAALVMQAAEGLLQGPAPSSDAMQRVAAQAQHLRAAAVTSADRAAVRTLDEIAQAWWSDTGLVDALHARLFLSILRASPPWPWTARGVALSPLVEAHVRGQHLGFHLILNDLPEAATILEDALLRLPMTHIGGGVTRSAFALLGAHASELMPFVASFERIHPERVVEYRPEPMPLSAIPVVAKRYRAAASAARPDLLAPLSDRERQVAELASRGLSNSAAGERLRISARTVEVHMTNILRKLGLRTRVELAALLSRGLSRDGDRDPE